MTGGKVTSGGEHGRILGIIYDNRGPVNGAEVEFRRLSTQSKRNSFSVYTNSHGEFDIRRAVPGSYTIFMHASGDRFQEIAVLDVQERKETKIFSCLRAK